MLQADPLEKQPPTIRGIFLGKSLTINNLCAAANDNEKATPPKGQWLDLLPAIIQMYLCADTDTDTDTFADARMRGKKTF